MDVCRPYSNEAVDSVTRYLTSVFDRLPYPRDVEVALIKDKGSKGGSRKCERCNGPGYYKEDFEEHDCGFKNLEGVKYIRCYCSPGLRLPNVKLESGKDIRDRAIALILAKKIATRAVDNEVISSLKQWGFYCWTQETYKAYLGLSKRITMNGLLYLEDMLKKYEPVDCQTIPLEIAEELVSTIERMPSKKWVNVIG